MPLNMRPEAPKKHHEHRSLGATLSPKLVHFVKKNREFFFTDVV